VCEEIAGNNENIRKGVLFLLHDASAHTSTLLEAAEGPRNSQPTATKHQQELEQSVPAPIVSSLPLGNMFRVVSALQQIMTELSGAVFEEAKIWSITKIVFNLMNDNGK
jgi:hypothetical protein